MWVVTYIVESCFVYIKTRRRCSNTLDLFTGTGGNLKEVTGHNAKKGCQLEIATIY